MQFWLRFLMVAAPFLVLVVKEISLLVISRYYSKKQPLDPIHIHAISILTFYIMLPLLLPYAAFVLFFLP